MVLEDVMGPLQDSVMWCGDCNSHNSLKGSNSRDTDGLVVEESIANDCLMSINNGEGAQYNSMQNTDAAQDLTFYIYCKRQV